MSHCRFTRKTVPLDWLQTDTWDPIDTQGLDQKKKIRIACLTQAIEHYVGGSHTSEFLAEHGLSRESLLRAFNRCLTHDARGRQLGWRGLLPGLRVRAPVRRKPLIASGRNGRGGLTGALALCLSKHSQVKEDFDRYLLSNAKRSAGHESKLRHKSAHQKFVDLCRKAGIQPFEWPLNTQSLGKGSIYNYVCRFVEARYDDVVATQFGSKAKAKSRTGTGHETRLKSTRPFDIVELDEHKCHFIGAIGVPTPDGVRWLPVQRVTLILAVDRTYSTVLGYKAIFRREADTDDLLDVLHIACGNHRPHTFQTSGMRYAHGAGFPCDLGEPFSSCGFNQLLLDNALIHLAMPIIGRARELIGCDVNFGPVARFERRPIVEYIFNALERAGFHRVQTTTGTGPHDPARQDPEAAAIGTKLTMAQALDLIDAVIADHNGKTGKRNFGSGPLKQLDAMRHDEAVGMLFPTLPPVAVGCAPLNRSIVPLSVRGDPKSGRRPYVYFQEETYAGVDLSDRWLLVGTEVVAHVNRDDIQTLDLYEKSGVKIGTVKVCGRWRHSPHSQDIRRYINKLIRDGYLAVEYDQDPVHVHLAALATELRQSQRKPSAALHVSVNAHAEESRVRAASAAPSVDDCVRGAIEHTQECVSEPAEEESWEMADLGAFNGVRE